MMFSCVKAMGGIEFGGISKIIRTTIGYLGMNCGEKVFLRNSVQFTENTGRYLQMQGAAFSRK